MYFAIFCIIILSANIQAGPLPKLRYRPPNVKLNPIKLVNASEEAFEFPDSRRIDTIVHFEVPSNDTSIYEKQRYNNKDNIRSPLGKNGEEIDIKLIGNKPIEEINDNDIKSLFGKKDYIHLTKGKKHHNNLLKIVEQLVAEEEIPSDQDGRSVMEEAFGLKRGSRRQGALPPKLVYEFNELVA